MVGNGLLIAMFMELYARDFAYVLKNHFVHISTGKVHEFLFLFGSMFFDKAIIKTSGLLRKNTNLLLKFEIQPQ